MLLHSMLGYLMRLGAPVKVLFVSTTLTAAALAGGKIAAAGLDALFAGAAPPNRVA